MGLRRPKRYPRATLLDGGSPVLFQGGSRVLLVQTYPESGPDSAHRVERSNNRLNGDHQDIGVIRLRLVCGTSLPPSLIRGCGLKPATTTERKLFQSSYITATMMCGGPNFL